MKLEAVFLTIWLLAFVAFGNISQPSNIATAKTWTYKFTLSWNNTDSSVTGYIIYRSTDSINYNQLVNIPNPAITNYDDTGLISGTYSYYMVAYNTVGNSSNSTTVTGIAP